MCFHDNLSKRITIAIDGPAGAGKSTLARRIAAKLGFVYVDTGAMYRAVALWALRTRVAPSDMHRLEQLANAAHIEFAPGDNAVLLNDENVTEAIRTPEVSQTASEVSLVPAVRRALVEKQREIGGQVSVVTEERATRRANESALPADLVEQQIRERDQRDRGRAESPLVQAPDAIYVDTTGLTIDEAEAAILKIIRDRTSNGRERTQ